MENARIVEEFTLPSFGKIYEDEVDPQVVLGSMKAKHEMLRLSSTEESHKIMAEIIDDCLESNLGISAYDLCVGDFQYLLFKLRIVTFGTEYELGGKCPFCGYEQRIVVNLDELTARTYTENFDRMRNLTLPITGSELTLTFQTPRMLDRVSTKVKEYRRRHRDSDLNPVILYNIISVIDEIDGEIPNALELEDWIMELPLADTNAIINRIDDMNNAIGLDLTVMQGCSICGTDYVIPFRINETFFRPRS